MAGTPTNGDGARAAELTGDETVESLLREVARIDDAAPPAAELVRPGELLGAYRIVRRLGQGAMGVVYEAEDLQLSRRVAVKVLAASRAGDDERRRRFLREARAAAAVVHPNVAAVYGVGHEGGLDYLAMEYVSGITLREAMRRRGGPFDIADAARIGEAIASGVGRAHELGIVHRDLKPENAMLTDAGAVKVLDFGLAKLAPAVLTRESPMFSNNVTVDGRILGTPAYMSPEQSKGRPVDARSDVFALGVILYELVTGRRPFRGDTAVELFIAIDRDEPPPPSTLRPQVPPALEAIVLRCLRKPSAERFASCREVAEALGRVAAGEDPVPAPVASDAELRLASIVRVSLPAIDPAASPAQPSAGAPHERSALAELLASHGACAATLVDGALIATFLQQPTGAGSATDLAVAAARCALAVRDAAPDVAIAVATGRALLAGTAPTGEAADRAAALAAARAAAHGAEILLDELSAGLLDGRCRVRDLGAGLFALDRAALAADVTRPLLGRPTPCVGRDAELTTLDVALGACCDDAVPRAILIVGPPGQGKTRLLHEWLRRTEARTDPPLVLLGRADPVRGAAGGLLAQALRPALGVTDGIAPDEARAALLAAVGRLVPEPLRVAELLGELCGVPFPDEGRVLLRSARTDPPTMAEQVETAWLEWLRATCEARPVVIVLEDLHWGDARTVSLVEAALRDLADGALLVLALARPEVDERFPELWMGRTQRLVLGPLARKASERLAREALGPLADPPLVERIVQLSEGNALFLEELVRAAAEGRGGEAPGTVMAMLQARIEQLSSDERRVLRVASVFGERFRTGDVGALLGADERRLDGWMRGLAQREVLAAHRGARAEHRFRHALVREAAYGTLLEAERRTLHRAAAEHLAAAADDPAVIAEHFERAGLSARAVPFYQDAARRALEGFETVDGLRLARRGLACGAEGEARGVLLAIDASARSARNMYEGVLAGALEAMSLVPPGTWAFCESAGIAIAAAMVHSPERERDRVPELVATMMQTEPRPDARRTYARIFAIVLTVLSATTPRPQLEPMFARLRAVCDLLVPWDPTARRWFHFASTRSMALCEPAPWRTLQAAEACLRDARSAGDRYVEHWLLVWDHELQWWQLGDEAAEGRLRAQLQAAIHRRTPALQAATAIQLARIACDTGDPAALAEGARQMRLLAEAPDGAAFGTALAYEHWARIELREGRPAAALAARGRDVFAFAPLYGLGATATLIRALVAEGRAAEAVRNSDEGLAVVARFGGAGYLEVELRLAASEACSAAGEVARSHAELAAALDQIRLRAEDIEDLDWRQRYLVRNADNRRARDLARAWGLPDPTAPLLSPADRATP